MFSKGNKTASRRSTPSIIGGDCTFTGDILSEGEVQIDGRLEGDVRCRNLVIGEQGSVTGEISAEAVNVLGTVTGQVTAQTVALARTARILGDITHDSLSVEVGAYVEGRFNRLPSETTSSIAASLAERELAHSSAGQQALLTSQPESDTAASDKSEDHAGPGKVVLLGN